ncbi:MAG: hypothetical protein CVT47_00540, partial [Thermoplasmata archaeon HGW-Thermoplasmata-2]
MNKGNGNNIGKCGRTGIKAMALTLTLMMMAAAIPAGIVMGEETPSTIPEILGQIPYGEIEAASIAPDP